MAFWKTISFSESTLLLSQERKPRLQALKGLILLILYGSTKRANAQVAACL